MCEVCHSSGRIWNMLQTTTDAFWYSSGSYQDQYINCKMVLLANLGALGIPVLIKKNWCPEACLHALYTATITWWSEQKKEEQTTGKQRVKVPKDSRTLYSAGQKFCTFYFFVTFLWPLCGRGTNFEQGGVYILHRASQDRHTAGAMQFTMGQAP